MGKLTTHVLDTARGVPGAGMAFTLYHVAQTRRRVTHGFTDADGRADAPLLDEAAFTTGTFELVFDVGRYFAAQDVATDDPPFLSEVAIRFTLAKDQHYHVPLLVSPWSYNTYRGS